MMTFLRRALANAVLAGAVLAACPVDARVADAPVRTSDGHEVLAKTMPAGSFVSQRAGDRFWNDDVAGLSGSPGGAPAGGSFSSARPGSIDEMTTAGMRYVHVEPSNCSPAADQPVRSCANGKTAARPAFLPEGATWAMMILGFGIAGFWLRRALLRSEARFDARIKQIEADAPNA